MAKKKKSQKHVHLATPINKKNVKTPGWVIPFILIVIFLAYIPALKAGFVNWDDGDYVNDNRLIKDFSNLKLLLTTPVQGNHHPLTMLSLAFNYAISGLNGWSYHLLNLLLHLINSFLVFRLAMLLSNRNTIIAFTTAILFGIHPMHVESVAWVSERKDVLYSLFFLGGLITYTKYADTGSRKQYFLTILLLVFSLLSKAAAVIFPVALFCIDILRKRKFTFKLFLEKVPFFILAMIDGIVTYLTQTEAGTTGAGLFGLGTRILMGFYGIMMYVLKMIAPFNLSPFYPFPAVNESLPIQYFLSPLFFIALVVLVFYSLKRSRVIAFGILFYLVNLLLVLQFLPVGSAVIAERYTYIPYIGLFYIIGWLIDRYTKSNITKAIYILLPVSLILAIGTFKQSGTWISGATLWDHAIKTQPSAQAFGNRALLLRKEKNYDLAIEYYSNAIKLNSVYHEAYANRGNVYFDLNKLDLAYQDYKKALSIKPGYHPALDNLGALFALQGQYDSAIKYTSMAISIKPDYRSAYRNRGYTYIQLKRHDEAIKDFRKFLEYDPNDPDVYNTIGICYRAQGKNQEAISSINKAIELNPDPHFFMNRSYAYYALKNIEFAKRDALTAKQGEIKIETNYAKLLGIQ
ncbi:MAG: tetratricopeptide repeat protein [Bacteroidota bacterium]|nr:tetratricopeptide repeat protein [Bacteroidota bacterium]